MINIIVAISKNRAIGLDNKLLWHISEDLKYFKKVTSGHPIIMGRKTFESIGSRALPKRQNIVITSSFEELRKQSEHGSFGNAASLHFVSSLEEALSLAKSQDEEVFIIGGGQIYLAALQSSFADRLYITNVDIEIPEADTYFPELRDDEWALESRTEEFIDEKSGLRYFFAIYNNQR